MSKFTEEKLEQAIIALLEDQGYPHHKGDTFERQPNEVLIKSDLRAFLASQYADDNITDGEIDSVIRRLEMLSAAEVSMSPPMAAEPVIPICRPAGALD